jgi:site-specific recombinase XerD
MHQLRHAYASILLDAGVTPKDAQHLLGHSNVAITQNVYTHILKSRAEQTAEKINAFFSAK